MPPVTNMWVSPIPRNVLEFEIRSRNPGGFLEFNLSSRKFLACRVMEPRSGPVTGNMANPVLYGKCDDDDDTADIDYFSYANCVYQQTEHSEQCENVLEFC